MKVFVAYRMGWISREKLLELAQPMLKNDYSGPELQKMLTGKIDGKVNEFDYHQAASALQ